MDLPESFRTFLSEIRPTKSQRDDCRVGHQTLRDRLNSNEELKPLLVSDFLQGSYRRATAVRPKGDLRSDVDIIVVTRLNKENYPDPNKAMDKFVPFLEKHYKGKYKRQGRSFGIELSYVDLDLVITSAPSEAEQVLYESAAVKTDASPEDEGYWRLTKAWAPAADKLGDSGWQLKEAAEAEWKTQSLWIPNREAQCWDETNPLEQIKWTWSKNAKCSGHYVNIVKALKWWQRVKYGDDRPKGFPLERLIGECCPNATKSVAEGVTLSLERIVDLYGISALLKRVPEMPDHGVPSHNVFGRITGEAFAKFYEHAKEAAAVARQALDATDRASSATKWRELFGDKFPPSDDGSGEGGGGPKGPFVVSVGKSPTGDLTPRKYG